MNCGVSACSSARRHLVVDLVGSRRDTASSAPLASAVSIAMTCRRASAAACPAARRASSDILPTCSTYCVRSSTDFGVVLQVVVAIGQAEAALIGDRHLDRRVLEVRPARRSWKNALTPIGVQLGDERRQIVDARQRGDLLQQRIERRDALRVDRRSRPCTSRSSRRSSSTRDRVPAAAAARESCGASRCCAPGSSSKRPQLGAVRRHRVLRDPAAAGELVEVGAGVGGLSSASSCRPDEDRAGAAGRAGRRRGWRRAPIGLRACRSRPAGARRRRQREQTCDHDRLLGTTLPGTRLRPAARPSVRLLAILPFRPSCPYHQTRHALVRTIGAFALHENAFWNSGMFDSRSVDAVLVRRVRVGRRLQPLGFRAARSRTRPAPSRGTRAAPA